MSSRSCQIIRASCLSFVVSASGMAAEEGMPRSTIEGWKQATVYVRVTKEGRSGSGSGFLFLREASRGYVATNSHVVAFSGPARQAGATAVTVVFSSGTAQQREMKAQIVGLDVARDLAVLRVDDAKLPLPINFERRVDLYETQPVYIFGFPFGRSLSPTKGDPAITVSMGAVSSIRRDDRDRLVAVQIDGSINPGNSGGPVVSRDGALIGIAVAKVQGTQIGLAIPSETLQQTIVGNLDSIAFNQQSTVGDVATFQVRGKTIDPLRRIRKVVVLSCPVGAPGLKSQVDAEGRWVPLSADAQKVSMTVEDGSFTGEIRLAANSTRDVLYLLQVRVERDTGQVSYSQPSELRVRKPVSKEIAGPQPPPKPLSQPPPPAMSRKPSQPLRPGPSTLAAGDSAARRPLPGNLKVRRLDFDAKDSVGQMVWSRDAEHLFLLTTNGLLSKIAVKDLRPAGSLDVHGVCNYLGQSAEGLVIALNSKLELAVVDGERMELKRRLRAPSSSYVATSLGSATAYIALGSPLSELTMIDLTGHNATRGITNAQIHENPPHAKHASLTVPFRNLEHLVLTPDGKYLFGISGECLHRFRVGDDRIVLEESGPRIGQGPRRVVVSQDSEDVAMPSGGGNYPVPGHPVVGYGTYIYRTTDLQVPRLGITTGPYPRSLTIDPVTRKIYAQNHDEQLIVLNEHGVKEAGYALAWRGDDARLLLAHPHGNRVCVLTGSDLFLVDLAE